MTPDFMHTYKTETKNETMQNDKSRSVRIWA